MDANKQMSRRGLSNKVVRTKFEMMLVRRLLLLYEQSPSVYHLSFVFVGANCARLTYSILQMDLQSAFVNFGHNTV